MKKTILILSMLLQFSLNLKSQEKIQLYYNWNWEITDKSKAAYTRDAEYDLNTMKLNGKVMDYNRLGAKIMEGTYSDGKRNGEFNFFYNNGVSESKGAYLNNNRVGNWDYYYSTGKLKQTIFFSNGIKNMDFAVIDYYDREGNQLVKNGTGKWINDSVRTGLFEGSSLKRLTGEFKDSLKAGEWKLIRLSDNKFIQSEKFKKGRFIEGKVYSPQSNDILGMNIEMLNKVPDQKNYKFYATERFKLDSTVFQKSLINSDVETIFKTFTGKEIKINNRNVIYPGGDFGLMDFIAGKLRYPVMAQMQKVTGRVFVTVRVDTLGNPKEVKILKGASEDLDNEALRVIKLIDKWLPAISEGKAFESSITIPIKFELKN